MWWSDSAPPAATHWSALGRVGRLSLEFTREATSTEAALVSALSDVKRAEPSAKLIETTLVTHT
jgi:hypothetical protein